MNIFVLDEDPRIAAQWHCDKHVVKMITETAQLLCSAYWTTEQKIEPPYKLAHKNHPCAIWARESKQNWQWLMRLGLELYKEYKYRYGNKKHLGGETILWLMFHQPELPDKGITKRPLCMPEDCKCEDTVKSYHEYYREYKSHLLQYRNRELPPWVEGTERTKCD